jgi:hypothetical protein
MEYVSLLAGEPWSDQPRCTHPLLAEVARVVNDSVSQRGRDRLVPLLPSVIGRVSEDPRTSAVLVDRLVATALDLGARDGLALRSHRRRARRRLRRLGPPAPAGAAPGRLDSLSDFAYREGPAVRAVHAVARTVGHLPEGRRDDALVELLVTATAALGPEPVVEPAVRPPVEDQRGYSVSSDLRRPD